MQQGMLVTHWHADPGESRGSKPCFADPKGSYFGWHKEIQARSTRGIVMRDAKEKWPRIIYVTPSHNSSWRTMSFSGRTGLLDSRVSQAFIFEDDYDAEFVLPGHSHRAGIDKRPVETAGTVSSLPLFAFGYMLRRAVVDSLVKIRMAMDQHSSPIDQRHWRVSLRRLFPDTIKRIEKLREATHFSSNQFNELRGTHLLCRFERD